MRILLVDDEVELTEPLSRLLRRQGYEVEVASDGETGCNMALSKQYDLLILDWMLPGKSGLEICQTVRSAPANAQSDAQLSTTPVLFLTAKDTLDDRVDGLDAGADDYLVKPFELRELLARIRALLRRPATLESQRIKPSPNQSQADGENVSATDDSNQKILSYDQLTLDLSNQLAQLEGQTIELSEKETQLLA